MLPRHLTLMAVMGTIMGCAPDPAPFARAFVIEDLTQGIGGPKASARPGDLMLENDQIRVAVLGERNSYGPAIFGGTLVDVDLQRWDPRYSQGNGNDHFAEMFPTANMNVMRADEETGSVEILQDGSDGGAAVIRVTAPTQGFLSMLDILWMITSAPKLQMVTDYVLEPGERWLRIRTSVTTGTGEAQVEGQPMEPVAESTPLLDYAMATGLVVGDFFLAGGSVSVFAPGIGFDEARAVHEAMEGGRNLFLDPFMVDFLAATAPGVSYGYASLDGELLVPMFTSNQTAGVSHVVEGSGASRRFEDGEVFTSERILAVGHGDVGSILDAVLEARGTPTGSLQGHVLERSTGEPLSGANVFAYRGDLESREAWPFSQWITDVRLDDDMPDGSFGGTLPPGTWTLQPHLKGHPKGTPLVVEIEEGDSLDVRLEIPMTGRARVQVVDETGRPIPAKVNFFATDGTQRRDADLGDGYLSGGSTEVVYLDTSPTEVKLPPGEYTAVASRGVEYELGEVGPFTVTGHDLVDMVLQVVRSVDSTGFISADFHIHSDTSFDSGTTKEKRLRSVAAEGVEFFPSTDHDYLTNYAPTAEAMGYEKWVRTAVGVEVSPLEMGHYLAFPLDMDHLALSGGAFQWTGMTPGEILWNLDELAPAGVTPLTMVAHPRDGILGYFDQFGFTPYESDGGAPTLNQSMLSLMNPILAEDNFTLDIDALEIFNSKRMELIRTPLQTEADLYSADRDEAIMADILTRTMEEQDALIAAEEQLAFGIMGQVDDWFTLLNLGKRITAVGNSDSHYPDSLPVGCPRNFVLSSTDTPAFIDTLEVVEAVRAHQVVASYGPFIRFEVEGQPIGSEVAAAGAVEMTIEVQSPTWFDVDRVELYENGTLVMEWLIDTPNSQVDNLRETFTLEPERDSWYVVVAMGSGGLDPVCPVQERPYIQFQDIVVEALASVESLSLDEYLDPSVPRPRSYPVHPYAITNPIWVDVGGDGWTPPGLPSWLTPPVAR